MTEEEASADARLYVCVLGECEIRINGKKAPIDLLAPWTEFNRREKNENQLFRMPSFHSYSRLYAGYDISGLLRGGDNVLEIWVAGGYYCQKQIYGEYCYGAPCVKVAIDVYCRGLFIPWWRPMRAFLAIPFPLRGLMFITGKNGMHCFVTNEVL